jgi:hypothetical protein
MTQASAWDLARWGTEAGIAKARRLFADVALCVPSRDGPCRQTARDLRVLIDLGALKLELNDSSNIPWARNATTARWLATGRPWSLWIDDDVWSSDSPAAWVEFVAIARENFANGEAIVAGAYPSKRLGGGAVCAAFLHPGRVILGDGGGYHEADWVGGGAVLLHRAAVSRMAEELPIPGPGRVSYSWRPGERYSGPKLWENGLRESNEADPCSPDSTTRLEEYGEDVGLAAHAYRAGIPIMVDTRLRLNHLGRHAFTWENALFGTSEREESLVLPCGSLAAEASKALHPDRIR